MPRKVVARVRLLFAFFARGTVWGGRGRRAREV